MAAVLSVGSTAIEWFLCAGALLCVHRRDEAVRFTALVYLLAVRLLSISLLTPILLLSGRGIPPHIAYSIYFYGYWSGFTIEAILSLLIIKSLFDLALTPLGGIRDLGKLVFRWAAAVSVALTLAVMFVPHPSGTAYVTKMLTELQRAQGVLTLCLLLFVCFAIRPLGLTYRSRPFGVILGLAILATVNLVSADWLAYSAEVASIVSHTRNIATIVALLLWITYFVLREPKRSLVVLPTTSPYLLWNQVAQALGDPPGFVAIAGVPPELFAPAELEMLRIASFKIRGTAFAPFEQSKIA